MIVVAGSINMDLVMELDHIPKVGETILSSCCNTISGGKGANQAMTIAKLEGNVSLLGKVGNDLYGRRILAEFDKWGLKYDSVEVCGTSETGQALIMVGKDGDNAIVVSQGANALVDKAYIQEQCDKIRTAEIVITQLEIPIETVAYILKIAKTFGKYTILNPAPAKELTGEMISNIDLLTPNETELALLSGMVVTTVDEALVAGRNLINRGIKAIIVTLGEKGCLYIDDKKHKHFEAKAVDVKDTTAAGDSFTGAIALGLTEGMDIETAIEFATEVASFTVARFGAQSSLPTRKEVVFNNLV